MVVRSIFSVLLLVSLAANGQIVDTSIATRFGPSIFLRLYDINKRMALDPHQQYLLARYYSNRDSVMTSWISKGKDPVFLDSVGKKQEQELSILLGMQQQKADRPSKINLLASVVAQGEVNYVREKYSPDSGVCRAMQKMLKDKYAQLFAICLADDDSNRMVSFAQQRNANYDLYSVYQGLYGKRFLDASVERMAAIKNVPDSIVGKIRKFFFVQSSHDPFSGWTGLFRQALQLYEPDTTLFSNLYRNEIQKQVYETLPAERYNLIYNYKVSPAGYETVLPLIKDRNYQRFLLSATYSMYQPKTCDSLILVISRRYDSLIESALLRDGSILPTSEFAIALKFKNELGLDPGLTDTLLYHAMYLAKRRDSILQSDPFASLNFGAYESRVMSGLLTDDQYTMLLSYKNRAQAAAEAESDWNEMVLRGIAGGFQRDEATRQMADYYLMKDNTWNRLEGDKIKQWDANIEMGDRKPAPLKVLDPIRWSRLPQKPANSLKVQW